MASDSHQEVEAVLCHKVTLRTWSMQYHGKVLCRYCGQRLYRSHLSDPCPVLVERRKQEETHGKA